MNENIRHIETPKYYKSHLNICIYVYSVGRNFRPVLTCLLIAFIWRHSPLFCPPVPVEIVDQPGLDIFGQVYNQWKNKECVCPNCNRSIAASRFAPHLEKCLGMGRNSSRIASRRSAHFIPASIQVKLYLSQKRNLVYSQYQEQVMQQKHFLNSTLLQGFYYLPVVNSFV